MMDKTFARAIINKLGGTGTPPEFGIETFTIGLERYLLVVEDELTEFGQFMKFEVISLCPIDLEGIDVDLLTEAEVEWINKYHNNVYTQLSPYLDQEENNWLKNVTRRI